MLRLAGLRQQLWPGKKGPVWTWVLSWDGILYGRPWEGPAVPGSNLNVLENPLGIWFK